MPFLIHNSRCRFLQAVASKLHGVEVDIKIIKRKGDPIISTLDAENNCKYFEAQQMKVDKRNCAGNKHDTNNQHINNNNITQVPSNDSLCEKSKLNDLVCCGILNVWPEGDHNLES